MEFGLKSSFEISAYSEQNQKVSTFDNYNHILCSQQVSDQLS